MQLILSNRVWVHFESHPKSLNVRSDFFRGEKVIYNLL